LQGTPGYLGPDGIITLLDYGMWLRRVKAYTQFSSAYNLQNYLPNNPAIYIDCVSDIGLKTTGDLYGVGLYSGNSDSMHLLKVTFDLKPLPWGWNFQDIGASLTVGGIADYYSGTFTLRGSGDNIEGKKDTLSFAYYNLVGDGAIIARVASQEKDSPNSIDGIMMRETLADNSKCVMVGVTNDAQARLNYRVNTGESASSNAYSISAPYWLKIERVGNVFSTFRSANGVQWTPFEGSKTINMTSSIYVGLTTAGSPPWNIHMCTFDNVEILPNR